jgi:hypothetical protein
MDFEGGSIMMTKLLTAMCAVPFALLLNNAIAQNAQSTDGNAQAQTGTGERKIGRGEGTDWAGERVPPGNSTLVMTCQGKTGRDKDECLGRAQDGQGNAGAPAKEGGEQYKPRTQ